MPIRRMGGTGGPGSRGGGGGGGSVELATAYVAIMPETSKLAPGVRRAAQSAAGALNQEISAGMQKAFQRGETYSSGFARAVGRDSIAISKGYDDVINKVTSWQQAEERLSNTLSNKKSNTNSVIQDTLARDRAYRAMETSVESLGLRMADYDAKAATYAERQIAGEKAKADAAERSARAQQATWQRNLSASQRYTQGQAKFNADAQARMDQAQQRGAATLDANLRRQNAAWQRNLTASQGYLRGQEKFTADSMARMDKIFSGGNGPGLSQMASGFKRAQNQMRTDLEYTATQGETRWERMSARMALSQSTVGGSLRNSMSSALSDVEARASSTMDGVRRGMLDAFGAPLGVRSTVAGGGLLASYAAFSGVDRILKGGFNRLETIQNAQVAMNAILGNQKEATDLINQTVAMAQGTPYTAAQFLSMARDMTTMGVATRQVVPSIQALADAMSLQGKGPETLEQLAREFGKIQAEGRITSRDALELQRVGGINVRGILANAMNIDSEDLVKKMSKPGGLQVDPTTIIDMLVKGIEQGSSGPGGTTPAYGGGMEAIRKTVSGSMSVLSAQMDRIGAAFLGGGSAASGGPADPNSFFGRLPAALNNVSDQFKVMANAGGPIDQFLAKFDSKGGGPLDVFMKGFQAFPKVVQGAMDLATRVMDGLQSPGAKQAITLLKQDLGGIWNVAKELAPTFLRLGGNIATGFGGVALTGLTVFTGLLKTVEPLISGITGIFADNKGIVEGAIGIWALMALRAKVAGVAMSGLSKITGAYNKQVYDFGTNTIQNESIWNRMAQNYRTAAGGADGFSKSLRTAYGAARSDGDGFVSAFRNGVVGAFRSGSEGASGFSNTTRSAFAAVRGAAGEMGSGLVGALGGPWGLAISGATIAVGLLANAHEQAAAKARQQKQDEDALRGTLEQNTALMTEQTYAAINKQLSDSGSLKKAQELGIDPHQIFQAGIGDDQAYGQFRGAAATAIRGQLETKKTPAGANLIEQYARVGISEDQLVSALLKEGNAFDVVNGKMAASALTADGSIPSLDSLTQIIAAGAGKYVDLAQAINAARFNTTAATEDQTRANEAMYGTWKATQVGIDAMHQFGASINAVPNNKSILLTADTPDAIAKMKEAGYEIQEIPGTKQFVAIPSTDEAKAAFLTLIQQINAAPPPQIKPQLDPTGAIGQGVQLSADLSKILGGINVTPVIPPGAAGLPNLLLPGQNPPVPAVATAPPPGPRRAVGGRLDNFRIRGPGTGTSDSIAAMVDGRTPINVSNQESINTAQSTADNWWLIDKMNKGLRVPHFADGGQFSWTDLLNPIDYLERLFLHHPRTDKQGPHRGPGGIAGFAGGGWFDWFKNRGAAAAHGSGAGSASTNVRERAGQAQAANLANPEAGPHDANYYGNRFLQGFGAEGANSAAGTVSMLGNPSSIYQGLAPLVGLGGAGAPGVGQSWKDFGKGVSHWDQWSTDALGAAGAMAFDFGTLPLGGEEGAAANVARDALDAPRIVTQRTPIQVVSPGLRSRIARPSTDEDLSIAAAEAWGMIPTFNAASPFIRQGGVDAVRRGYGGLDPVGADQTSYMVGKWNEDRQNRFVRDYAYGQGPPSMGILDAPGDVPAAIQEYLRTIGRNYAAGMVHSDPTDQLLYRGLGLMPDELARIRARGTMSFPMSSFTPNAEAAAAYGQNPAWWQKIPEGATPVTLRLQRGAQVVDAGADSGSHPVGLSEMLAQGQFDVRGIKEPKWNPELNKLTPHEIILRQRSLDPANYDLPSLLNPYWEHAIGHAKGGMILAQGNAIDHHFGSRPKTRFAGGGALGNSIGSGDDWFKWLTTKRNALMGGDALPSSNPNSAAAPWGQTSEGIYINKDGTPYNRIPRGVSIDPTSGSPKKVSLSDADPEWWLHPGYGGGTWNPRSAHDSGIGQWQEPTGSGRYNLPGGGIGMYHPGSRRFSFAKGGPFKTDDFTGSAINRDDYSSFAEFLHAWNLAHAMGMWSGPGKYAGGGFMSGMVAPPPYDPHKQTAGRGGAPHRIIWWGGKDGLPPLAGPDDPLLPIEWGPKGNPDRNGTNPDGKWGGWYDWLRPGDPGYVEHQHRRGIHNFSGGGRMDSQGRIFGPGTGTSDSIMGLVDGMKPIKVSNKESVNTAHSTANNWRTIDAMNKGAVIPPWLLSMAGVRGFADGGGLGAAYQTGYAMNGKPYANSFGDSAADCSGFVSMIVNAATGMGADGARMTTQTAAAWLQAHGAIIGEPPGPGFLEVGWYNNGPGIQDGHMAGTMPDGTNFEAGGRGGNVQFGGSATGANASEFKQHAWFPYTALYPDGTVTVPPGSPPTTPYGSAGGGGGASAMSSGGSMTPKQAEALQGQIQKSGEAVVSTQHDIEIAQQHIDDLNNAKTPPKPATMDRAQETLRKATQAHEDALAKQSALQQKADTTPVSAGGTGKGGSQLGGTSEDGQTLGKGLVDGVFQSLGIDGSVFSDPRQWAGVKSFEALLNWFTKPMGTNTVGGGLFGLAQGKQQPGYGDIAQPATDPKGMLVDAIVSQGLQHGGGNNEIQAALMAGLQESGLTTGATNGNHVGPFQMDAAKGPEGSRRDPNFAANWFFDQAMNIPGHEKMDPGQLAEAVEQSGEGQRYGPHASEAQQLLQAALARRGGGSQHGAAGYGPGPGNNDALSGYNNYDAGGGGGSGAPGLANLGTGLFSGLMQSLGLGGGGTPSVAPGIANPDVPVPGATPAPQLDQSGAQDVTQSAYQPQFPTDTSNTYDQGQQPGAPMAANVGNVSFHLAPGATLGWDPAKTFSAAQSHANMKTNQSGGGRTVLL